MRINKIIYLLAFFISVFAPINLRAFTGKAVILIDAEDDLGAVNKKVFGNNFIGYDPMTYENWAKEYYGYSDYGAGIWDPVTQRSVKEVVDLAKDAGITILRFPGGCGTHRYSWKNTIGRKRSHFLYGLDEFLKTCEEIGAEPIITISYFTGNEFDAADLIEYLNAPSDPNHKWAMMRAENGHSQPYNVKYFEIGNEDWHGDHRKIKEVFPQDYARRYLKYYKKMKAIDPHIKIGAILNSDKWNSAVLERIKDHVDFCIIHIYPFPDASIDKIKKMDPKDIFRETLGIVLSREEAALKKTIKIIKEIAKKDMPLAITEYNGGFWQDEPVPYRHCLGAALLNAELLRIFMKPEFNILMANYWDFVNEYWGMIANGFQGGKENLYNKYYKRPNFYVFELYKRHFGERLISAEVYSESCETNIPYISVNASKSLDGKKLYLMVINKDMENSVTASIRVKGFSPLRKAVVAVLNGPSIDATNEINHNQVKFREFNFNLGKEKLHFTFKPHSLTAVELQRNQ